MCLGGVSDCSTGEQGGGVWNVGPESIQERLELAGVLRFSPQRKEEGGVKIPSSSLKIAIEFIDNGRIITFFRGFLLFIYNNSCHNLFIVKTYFSSPVEIKLKVSHFCAYMHQF